MAETATRDIPILMNAEMVRAILGGRKTQTRRPVKPQPPEGAKICGPELYHPTVERGGIEQPGDLICGIYDEYGEWGVKCPFGQVGDRLYVRETCARSRNNWLYRADMGNTRCKPSECTDEWDWDSSCVDQWTPSIHAPKQSSRITLEVTGVRVERVTAITKPGVYSEGIVIEGRPSDYGRDSVLACDGHLHLSWASAWVSVWDSIYKDGYGWEANPWVWVGEFKRITERTS